MVNYNNGKVYQICDVANTKRYIGSTTLSHLSQRFQQHKMAYNLWKQSGQGYYSSFKVFDEFGIENCKIELLELCNCETKDQLNKKEGEYIRSLDCENKVIPQRTPQEHYQDNRTEIRTLANESIECLICKKQYKRCNKVHHEKTKYCLAELKKLKDESIIMTYESPPMVPVGEDGTQGSQGEFKQVVLTSGEPSVEDIEKFNEAITSLNNYVVEVLIPEQNIITPEERELINKIF